MGSDGVQNGNVKRLDISDYNLPPQGEHIVDRNAQRKEVVNDAIASFFADGQISAEELKKLADMGYSVIDINNALNEVRSFKPDRNDLPPQGEHLSRTPTLKEQANELFKKLGFIK